MQLVTAGIGDHTLVFTPNVDPYNAGVGFPMRRTSGVALHDTGDDTNQRPRSNRTVAVRRRAVSASTPAGSPRT